MRSVLPSLLPFTSLAVLCVSDPDCHTAEWHKSEKATFVFGLNNQVFFYDIFSSTINEQRLVDAAQEAINIMGIDMSTPSVQLLTAYLHKYRGGSYVFDYTEEPSVTLPSVHRCHTLVNDTLICPPDCIQLEMDGPDRVRVKRSFQDKDKCERAIDNIEEKYNPCAGKRERDAPNADYVACLETLATMSSTIGPSSGMKIMICASGGIASIRSAPISASSAIMGIPTFKFTGCCIPTNARARSGTESSWWTTLNGSH
ncbi:hypothetical protein L596_025796 [Steinernema carpocapsae]|uniref:Uncharacterized protein n=1 Tax=Steinernema carpocapsae TaxID=34508 RepID=A0A4V5ZYW8_STECR|nr:hypothetical protein L596_025796 [Steinernema carpocapsae]